MSRSAAALRIVHSGEPIGVGDIVRTGDARYPHYEVIAISGERAWVRDVQYGSDHVVTLASLRKAPSSIRKAYSRT